MAWILPRDRSVRVASGMTERPLLDLLEGEIFSINPKANQFVLSNVDPTKNGYGEVTANKLVDGKSGEQVIFAFSDFVDRTVCVWGEVVEEEESKEDLYLEFDRIRMKSSGLEGTIIGATNQDGLKFIALWDEISQGQWTFEVSPSEIDHLGVKATGKTLAFAKESKPMIMDRQKAQEKLNEDTTKEEVVAVIEAKAKDRQRRQAYQEEINQQNQQQVAKLARTVVDANLVEFNNIVQAGVLTVTAGENNYEIDVLAEIVDGYFDSILSRVASHVPDLGTRYHVVAEISNVLAGLMVDQYMMTRDGYIRESDGTWGVFTKKGTIIGSCATKKKALRLIRAREWRKREGKETE